jgi:DNA-binding LacI/PurR family transcriptional regulator
MAGLSHVTLAEVTVVELPPKSARRPTLEDVASAAGVSRALVSIVVRGARGASAETRARVLAVVEELGYRPDVRARLLARSSPRLLGVTYRIGSLHHADLLTPIYEAAEKAGYEVILSGKTPLHEERRAVTALLGYRCDAVLMLGAALPERELDELARPVPFVLVGRRLIHPNPNLDLVRTDERAGMGLAVDHLVALGHGHIAHVDGGPGTKSNDRRQGYREHMKRVGLGDRIQVEAGGEDLGVAGRRAGERLFASAPRPTAVIAYNDEAAWGVMRAATDRGLEVPRDLSVVGYDGSPLARVAPLELTSVRQDANVLGKLAVELAVGRLEGAADARDLVLAPSLVPGETTARAPTGHDGPQSAGAPS